MAKLSKTTLTVIIAAAVVLVLGAVLLFLMMTEPKGGDTSSDSGASSSGADPSSGESSSASTSDSGNSSAASGEIVITDKEKENILKLEVSNETGSYSFDRKSRQVSSSGEDGAVTTTTQYYWLSPELNGVAHNDSTIGAFMNSMASVKASSMVEENAADLDKYGLKDPVSTVKITFDDGTAKELCFGIRNPAATNYVYICEKGSNDVMQAGYYSTGSVFYDVKDFVNLILTESYDANNPKELDYLIIERKDLEEPIEIEYMYDIAEEVEDEDSVITTFNTHRITAPITAELDTISGQSICYGLYALNMSDCVYIDPTAEELAAAGFNDPFCRVKFKYGGKERVLLLGNEVRSTDSSEDGGGLSSVSGYYAMLEGDRLVYEISTSKAPWYTCKAEGIMSRRPISPYIYTVDTLTITTPDGEFEFKVNGDADEHSFMYGSQTLSDSGFKGMYQYLITAMGEELYFSDEQLEPYITVKFTYRDEYHEIYGRGEDVIVYYKSDDRKSKVSVNGSILYKVRQIYTDRLLENLDALLNGGDIKLDW